jgi:hypothetical protein
MTEAAVRRPLLYQHFTRVANSLLADYEKTKSQQSSANIGFNREIICEEFLKGSLPPRLSIRRGEIWDSSGNKTGQHELIILRDDAASLAIGAADTYLAEGVFAVIEGKSELTKEKLREALEQLKAVRALSLSRPTQRVLQSLFTLFGPLCCIFAYEGATLETILSEVEEPQNANVVDLICVLTRGAIIHKSSLVYWQEQSPFVTCHGKAASLAWLYYHLVGYSGSFLKRDFMLHPYFEPLNGWSE